MLPFREITLEDKAAVEKCGSHYNYHLCERCFVDLFMWRSHYNTQIRRKKFLRLRALAVIMIRVAQAFGST